MEILPAMSNTMACKKFKKIAVSNSEDYKMNWKMVLSTWEEVIAMIPWFTDINMAFDPQHACNITFNLQTTNRSGQSCSICRRYFDERLVMYIN